MGVYIKTENKYIKNNSLIHSGFIELKVDLSSPLFLMKSLEHRGRLNLGLCIDLS